MKSLSESLFDKDLIQKDIPVFGDLYKPDSIAYPATPPDIGYREAYLDILDNFNSINWQNIELAKKQLDELPERLATDQSFVNAAKNSNKETAMQQCAASLMMSVAQMLSENTEFCRNYLDNPDFMNFINQRVFESVYKDLTAKLHRVEDDKDVRNYIFDRLQMDSSLSDMQIASEVVAKFGEKYGGMTANNWRHIIEDYTSMIRFANQRPAKEISLKLKEAASPENEEE